jgi:hypothetical protein
LFAMMATADRRIPIEVQWFAQMAAESGGTVTPSAPTLAVQAGSTVARRRQAARELRERVFMRAMIVAIAPLVYSTGQDRAAASGDHSSAGNARAVPRLGRSGAD